MTPRQHTTGLALGILACWLAWPAAHADVRAQAKQAPVRTTQGQPAAPEPPVASPSVEPMPVESPDAVAPAPQVFVGPPPALVVPTCPEDPPVPVVAIRVRVAACSAPLQEIEYHICVQNTSAAPAHHVLVRNPLPANARFVRASPEPHSTKPELQWRLGTVAPGACRDLTLVLAPTDECDVKNCARVQFEHGQCVTTRIARSVPLPVVPGAELPPGAVPGAPPASKPWEAPAPGAKEEPVPPKGATKLTLNVDGPKQQYANLTAKYQLTVHNTGTAAATRVLVTNPIPMGMTLVSASAGSRLHAGQVAWFLGDLKAGEVRTVQIVLRAKGPGKLCNRATALGDGGLKAEAELCTRFEGVSAVGVEVTDSRDPLPVGQETTYTVVVVNQGSAPVTNVQVKAVIPPGLTLVGATGPSDPPPKDRLPEATAEGQPLPFAPLKTLAPGKEARYQLTVRALRAGDLRFRVEITADQLEAGPVREQESTQVFPVDESVRP